MPRVVGFDLVEAGVEFGEVGLGVLLGGGGGEGEEGEFLVAEAGKRVRSDNLVSCHVRR